MKRASTKQKIKAGEKPTEGESEEESQDSPENEVVGNLIDNLFALATLAGVDPKTLDTYQEDFSSQAGVIEVMGQMDKLVLDMEKALEEKLNKMDAIIGSKVKTFKMKDVLDISMLQELAGLFETFGSDSKRVTKQFDHWDKNYTELDQRLNVANTQIKLIDDRKESFPLGGTMNIADKEEALLLSHPKVEAKVLDLQKEWDALHDKAGQIIMDNLHWDFKPDVVLHLCINCGIYLQHAQETLFDYQTLPKWNDNDAFKVFGKSPVLAKNRLEAIAYKRMKEEESGPKTKKKNKEEESEPKPKKKNKAIKLTL